MALGQISLQIVCLTVTVVAEGSTDGVYSRGAKGIQTVMLEFTFDGRTIKVHPTALPKIDEPFSQL